MLIGKDDARIPKTRIRIAMIENIVPLKGLPDTHAKAATENNGMLSKTPNNRYEGTHFNANAIIKA
ncbi:MAG: hypothetical protein P8100_09535 [bacterium]